ncbi:MAG: hypothetical protein RIM99_02725 [Cyclobacteriaceae bacterium]
MRTLIVLLLSVLMLGIADDVDAQRRRPKGKYAARKKNNKKISHYKGGVRGYGRFKPYYFIGANINAGNYFGDLAPVSKKASTDVSFTRPGFGFHGGYKFHHSLAIRGGLNWVRVSGDDYSADPNGETSQARYARNLSFRNDIKEFQLGLEISLLPNHGGVDQRLPLNAYLFIGGAIFMHDPMAKVPDADYQTDITGATSAPQAGEWVKLRPLGTEGQNLGVIEPYSNIEFSVPVAIGATMKLPGTDFNVGLEFGFRYLFTDYIDDVSSNYVGLDQFTDPLARILSDRSAEPTSSQGNARSIDAFGIHNLSAHGLYSASFIGGGYDGGIRGNPDNNDMIFVTQIKLTYLLSKSPKRSAKFR